MICSHNQILAGDLLACSGEEPSTACAVMRRRLRASVSSHPHPATHAPAAQSRPLSRMAVSMSHAMMSISGSAAKLRGGKASKRAAVAKAARADANNEVRRKSHTPLQPSFLFPTFLTHRYPALIRREKKVHIPSGRFPSADEPPLSLQSPTSSSRRATRSAVPVRRVLARSRGGALGRAPAGQRQRQEDLPSRLHWLHRHADAGHRGGAPRQVRDRRPLRGTFAHFRRGPQPRALAKDAERSYVAARSSTRVDDRRANAAHPPRAFARGRPPSPLSSSSKSESASPSALLPSIDDDDDRLPPVADTRGARRT